MKKKSGKIKETKTNMEKLIKIWNFF